MSAADVTSVAYLAAAILFILGLKGLARPRTAPRGNLLGASGMLVAVLATLLDRSIVDFRVLLAGLVVGSAIGAVLAVRVRMTGMPQLVALFNGFGGGASVLVAGASFLEVVDTGRVDDQLAVAAALTALIGIVTLTGSLVAFAKLQEVLSLRGFRGQGVLRALLAVVAVASATMVVVSPGDVGWFWLLVGAGALLGVLGTVAIGGADMPVVIALLNAFSGNIAGDGPIYPFFAGDFVDLIREPSGCRQKPPAILLQARRAAYWSASFLRQYSRLLRRPALGMWATSGR